jgi:leucine dehydrogenase
MEIMKEMNKLGHEQIVFCNDPASGLKAIIAIHSTVLGPALGGCRFWNYRSEEDAISDVLRLSRGMTYKAALANLPLGGGKSVIIGDPDRLKTKELFRAFGKFVNSMGGRYITAEDVNVRVEDMNIVAAETAFVTGTTSVAGGSGDPSPVTALGVFSGIKAAVKHRLHRDSLTGIRVAVQGCGAVGSHLCQLLAEAGAKLVVADISAQATAKIREKYQAEIVPTESIHQQAVEVYSPCALGGILNPSSIAEVKAPIIAGGANNQLLDEVRDSEALRTRNILYAPDYVINAGGLINVCHELRGYRAEHALDDARKIYHTLMEIFIKAENKGITTLAASNAIAEDKINLALQRGSQRVVHTFNNQQWIKMRR